MNAPTLPSYSRYILTSLGEQTLVFGDVFVSEIILVERAYLLPLPFYTPALLGVIHRQGEIVSLTSLRRLLSDPNDLIPEKLTVVLLSKVAQDLAGVGLVVDKVQSSVSSEQYAKLRHQDLTTPYLQLEDLLPRIPAYIWQPQRWLL